MVGGIEFEMRLNHNGIVIVCSQNKVRFCQNSQRVSSREPLFQQGGNGGLEGDGCVLQAARVLGSSLLSLVGD